MKFSEQVKTDLMGIIFKMSSQTDDFVKNPKVDFSRKRKLDFSTFLHLFISMEAGTINDELLRYFSYQD